MTAFDILRLNLKRLRIAQGLTQEKLAEKAGLEYKHYQRIESGKKVGLQLRTIEALAKVLKVEVKELFDLSPAPVIEKYTIALTEEYQGKKRQ